MNVIRAFLLLPMTLVLALCANDSSMRTEQADVTEQTAAESRRPREVEALLKSRESRDAPIPAELFAAAKRGQGEEPRQILAAALTSRDDNQAAQAASAILRKYGCDAVRGEVRAQALRHLRTFPTPQGALLLGCLEHDMVAMEVLRSFEPFLHLRSFGSDFADWETVRFYALAEAGDREAKRMIIERIEDGDLELLIPLLLHNGFPYIRDRDILLALTSALLDERLMRPGDRTDTDYLNPRISDLALSEFDFRFKLGVRGDRVPPGGYTEVHKRAAYDLARQLLGGLAAGEKLPQGQRAAEVLSNEDARGSVRQGIQ